jgi:hypothetical protein
MIRKLGLISIFALFLPQLLLSQVKFSDFFNNSSLRIDYLLNGTADTAEVIIKQLKKEPNFGGTHTHLAGPGKFGTYRYQVFDKKTNTVIYSKGFCPIFQEWQTTSEAKIKKGSFYQVAILPFPKKEIRFAIEERNWDGQFVEIFSADIDPENYFILDEKPPGYQVETIANHGSPQHKVDLLFLPEGYTSGEMDKFIADAKRMAKALFASKSFCKHEKDFNLYAVKAPSLESGTDIPGERIYKNTAFNSNFYTFDTPRYLTSLDLLNIHDAAALVPYDHIYLLVNTERYGGGGFYNFLSVTSVDNSQSEKVFVHEFGHGFAGLADEYYTSDVAYSDYYNLAVEPWETNITTLVDFSSKWKDLLGEDIPVPTPRTAKYTKAVGVFEGGGYLAKGIYSPVMDCRMKSNEAKDFCPVCKQTIEEMIKWHCE